mgnify:CR=1 FL=1
MTVDPSSAAVGLVLGLLLGGGGSLLSAFLLLATVAVSRQKRALEAAEAENARMKRDAAWPGDSA